ncbi:MAG TPA: branched-chain amino acid ABC transporter permease [Candidatus Elarobacter sp.]|jgi:branched-chain amino acid transport system permease protein|nr:branched-chain amino acid ABC transporter permease [Candidatus Elarobacter sp.]
MTTIALLLITGLGLGALYFLIAAGLSLIWGLMRVLNFAHGAFFTVAAYAGWSAANAAGGAPVGVRWLIAVLVAVIVGAVFATLTEVLLIRPLYARHVGQVLVTVGLSLATISLVQGGFGSDPQTFALPSWMTATTNVIGANVPNTRLLVIAVAALVFALLLFFLRRTRFGLIVRAGVENRAMVQALGIDVQRAFTLVFAIGGAAAGLAGMLAATYYGTIDPGRGTSMLIFAFIVVIIGGLGSVTGSAVAAIVVGVIQQFLNYYATGIGDFSVVLLLAIVLLFRPGGFSGTTT